MAVQPPRDTTFALNEDDLIERFTRKTGKGGQNRNKRDMAVMLTHRPTGVTVTIDSRSQADNRRVAREELLRKLKTAWTAGEIEAAASQKRLQVGSGQRGDAHRTYAVQHGIVTDRRTGKKATLDAILDGHLELLR
ncbi:peptide chain release factor family protein [Burkholderia cenocepacia]|uniref:peptide chain release factor family protein n=1 Tax=Burkholderia cenocepacia TaxID=95486 RepID=UPI00076DBB1B|nr:peptide chain release factor-like protein [Burkholderia cenocepacia]KWU17864.1 hypothetical protein AS149_14190 [Burkholderia cenocepacia]